MQIHYSGLSPNHIFNRINGNETKRNAKIKNGVSYSSVSANAVSSKTNQVDRIELSGQAADSVPDEIKTALTEELSRPADTVRLETLQNSIRGGQYMFDSAELAKIMLADKSAVL